ncbi:hypothetical protein CHARACLAT_010470 [Characodon lateralis]|uniref:Uncharacterized protein n=1 Tax=Characodon lateralis TaxID=208331 RepID=A0ABU7DPZ3_9TELE|nr:hypothetical protein [Characodon lateralis]
MLSFAPMLRLRESEGEGGEALVYIDSEEVGGACTGCDGQVLLHRCSSSVSNQLGFFREWRARGRRQLDVVHSVIQPCRVFHGFFFTSSLE